MLDRATVDRLRTYEGGMDPVLSVYLAVHPGDGRGMSARLKDMLAPLRDAGQARHGWAISLRSDIEAVIGMADRIAVEAGNGVGLFRCAATGLDEQLLLPDRIRDRAVVAHRPYLAPIDAVIDYYREYLVTLLDGNRAVLYRHGIGTFEEVDTFTDEEIRKSNYGGFAGYEERRVRSHADGVRTRLHRSVLEGVKERMRVGQIEGLVAAGTHNHVDGFKRDAQDSGVLVGTFAIDPHTATLASVRAASAKVVDEHRAGLERAGVERILEMEAAGGPAVVGVRAALNAVNQRAADVLWVQPGDVTGGSQCTDCSWLTVDGRGLCPVCGEALAHVPDIYDAMAMAVRRAGGRVRNVLTETPLEEHRVAVALRFPLRVSIS